MAKRKSLEAIRPLQLLKSPVSSPSPQTLRAFLPKTQKNQAVVLEPEGPVVSTVFYFPGCGSERVFGQIAMASLFILLKTGCRVILPPPFLCCGYPLKVNAQKETADRINLENIIILTQIREMFHDLDFDGCLVSCGTCMESLDGLGIESVFGAAVEDVSGFVLKRGGQLPKFPRSYLYHAPCHDSLKDKGLSLLKNLGLDVTFVPHCCSEAGTMALSRPDISHSMLMRKRKAIEDAQPEKGTRILTNCPSCIQGLGRHKGLNIIPVHLAQELAFLMEGQPWVQSFKTLAAKGETVHF